MRIIIFGRAMTDHAQEKTKLESKVQHLSWDSLRYIGLYTSPLLKLCSEGLKTEYKAACMQAKTAIEAFASCLTVSDISLSDSSVEMANTRFHILLQQLSTLTFDQVKYAEMRRVIQVFTALCQASLNPESSGELTLEFDAIRRLRAQTNRLKEEVALKYSGSFLCELFKPLDGQFSDTRLRAHIDSDPAPARRADQALNFLMNFFEFAKVHKLLNKDLLELPPLLRLYRAETLASYRELQHKAYEQGLWCVELQKRYRQISQSAEKSPLVLEEEIRMTAREILNKEDACRDALIRIKKLLPTPAVDIMAFLLSDPVPWNKSPRDVKQAAQLPKKAIEPSPVTAPERRLARQLQDTPLCVVVDSLGKAREAARQAKEQYDRWNIFLRDLQSVSVTDLSRKDLQARVKHIIREILTEPRPYEQAISALHVLLTYRIKQSGIDAVSMNLWRNILVETAAALRIKPPIDSEADDISTVLAPSFEVSPVVFREHKEQKQSELGSYAHFDWEALLYLGRNAAVVSSGWKGKPYESLQAFEATVRSLYNRKKLAVVRADLAKPRSLLLNIILELQKPEGCDNNSGLKFFRKRCLQEISAYYDPTAYQATFTWEELRSLALLVKYLLSEYSTRGVWPYMAEKIFVNRSPQLERYPFLKPSYHFASWFNTAADSVEPPFLAFGYDLIDNMPLPFSIESACGLRRAHQDLYAIVDCINQMRVRVEFEQPILSDIYKELPRVNLFMRSMRTLIETRIRELRDDYSIAYQKHIQLFEEYQQLMKKCAILRQKSAGKTAQIRAGIFEGMNREESCQLALRRVGIFAARNKAPWLQEISPIIAELKATKVSVETAAPTAPTAAIALAAEPISLQPMTLHLLDWESLEKIHSSVVPCAQILSAMSYYYSSKKADRGILVELIRKFGQYFLSSASRGEPQLSNANSVLATLIDRLVNSPNFPSFIWEHPELHERFLSDYDTEIRKVLETGLVTYAEIISHNNALIQKKSELSTRINTEESAELYSAKLRSQVIRALIQESEKRRPFEQAAIMTGYIASQVPRDSAADTVIYEISNALK